MFKLRKILTSGVNVAEGVYLTAASGTTYKIGAAAKLSGGKAVMAGATDMPTHIIGENLEAGAASRVFCYPVLPEMVFETEFSVVPTSILEGSKVTLAVSDGVAYGVTATTASGVATIYDMAGAAAAGDTVYIRFQ